MRDELVIQSISQLRALAHPLRQRILRALADEPHTNKQLAALLNESPARLHFHVRELAEAGLIELVQEVPKRGVVEKYYRATARNIRVASSVSGNAFLLEELPEATLDAARQELAQATAAFGGPPPGTRIFHQQLRLSADTLARLQQYLDAIEQEAQDSTPMSDVEGQIQSFMLTYVLHPIVSSHTTNESFGEEQE